MKIKLFIILFTFSLLFAYSGKIAQAQTTNSSQGLGCGGGFGVIADFLCQNNTKEDVGNTLNKVISGVIGFLTMIAALWFIFQFITAGFQWISAGGDKNDTTAARDKITNSLIGLVIVVIAWAIIGVIGSMLGLSILNPGSVLQNLGI